MRRSLAAVHRPRPMSLTNRSGVRRAATAGDAIDNSAQPDSVIRTARPKVMSAPRASVDEVDHGVEARDLEDATHRSLDVTERDVGAFGERLLQHGDEHRDAVRIAEREGFEVDGQTVSRDDGSHERLLDRIA